MDEFPGPADPPAVTEQALPGCLAHRGSPEDDRLDGQELGIVCQIDG